MTTTDAFETRLTAALDHALTPTQLVTLDERFGEALRSATHSPRRRRLTGRRLALVGLVLLVPTVMAAGGVFSTEDPYGLADATEFAAELDAAKAITPIPPGAVWPDYLAVNDAAGAYSRGGGRAWVEIIGMCLWEADWLNARTAGDAAREALARSTILGFPDWWSTESIFFQPDGARRTYLAPIVAGVRSGNPGPVEEDVNLNCAGVGPFVPGP